VSWNTHISRTNQPTGEALRLLRKISDLAYDEDVGDPLDCAIGYANKALAALSTSQPNRMGNLIDRLRSPLWVHSPIAFDSPQLEQEENIAAMNEAADKLATLAATPAVAPSQPELCPYCSDGKRTGLPGNACENCMNTGLKYPERAPEPDAWRIEWVDGILSFSVRKPFDDSSAIKVITPLYAATPAVGGEEGARLSNWLADYSHDLMEDGDLDQEAAEIAKASQWIADRLAKPASVITDEMVLAGAKAANPFAWEMDEDGEYLLEYKHGAREATLNEVRQILTAALSKET
jgi:hypothetical protein